MSPAQPPLQSQSQPESQSHPAPPLRYHVVHETLYTYQDVVTLSQQVLHLSPRSFDYQQTVSHRIDVDQPIADSSERLDYFGNLARHFSVTTPHKRLLVRAESTVAMQPRPDLAAIAGSAPWEQLRDLVQRAVDPVLHEACRYLYESPHVRWNTEIADYARVSFTPERPLLEAALELTERIFEDFEFDSQATDIATPLEQVMKGRRGVCQDFAQLMIGCLRSLGLPARYMSGYILTHPPEGQPRMIGSDASHAWVSVFCLGLGWVDFDPTNRCLVQYEHLTLGWGRDFSDVTPMRGIVLGGGEQVLQVNVTMTPLQGGAAGEPGQSQGQSHSQGQSQGQSQSQGGQTQSQSQSPSVARDQTVAPVQSQSWYNTVFPSPSPVPVRPAHRDGA